MGVQKVDAPVRVKVADGATIQCDSQLSEANWSIQGLQFTNSLKVFPLTTFDMILGMDWLERHNPMNIHWHEKWVQLPYDDSVMVLLGTGATLPAGSVV